MCCLKFFFLNHSKCCLCHTRWASTGNSVFYYRCYVFIFIHWCILPLEIYSAVCSRGRAPVLQVQSPELKNQSPTTKINKQINKIVYLAVRLFIYLWRYWRLNLGPCACQAAFYHLGCAPSPHLFSHILRWLPNITYLLDIWFDSSSLPFSFSLSLRSLTV